MDSPVLDRLLVHGSLVPMSRPSTGIWLGSAVFAGHIRVTKHTCMHTYKQTTLRVASVAWPHLCYAGDAA